MYVYPGAFVDIGDGVHKLPPLAQLRIFCGGVWHNAILTSLCLIGIVFLPHFVAPLYRYSAPSMGPFIVSVNKDSALSEILLPPGTLTAIGDCRVRTVVDYQNCLYQSMQFLGNNSMGYCADKSYLKKNENLKDLVGCCAEGYTGQLQCFVSQDGEHYCLSAKESIRFPTCLPQSVSAEVSCDCIFPVLPPDVGIFHLHTRALNKDAAETKDKDIVFAGTPIELWYSFELRDYVSKWDFLSSIDLPLIIEKGLRYTASISGALAILNMAPVYYLDGEWCLKPFILLFESWAGRTTNNTEEEGRKRDYYVTLILRTVSILFVINVIISLYNIPPNRTT